MAGVDDQYIPQNTSASTSAMPTQQGKKTKIPSNCNLFITKIIYPIIKYIPLQVLLMINTFLKTERCIQQQYPHNKVK
jgi:hypothetical protein